MKKIISVLLTAILLCSSAALTGCKNESTDSNDKQSSVVQQSDERTVSAEEASNQNESGLKKAMKDIIENYGFEGIAYAVKDGEVVLSYGEGTLDNDIPITVDTPMPIGSVSKQFCAAAILKLRDEGKLSLDDTLDKYYPEYEHAGKITLKLMLSMRSGIPNYTNELESGYVSKDNTEEENMEQTLKWMFSQSLDFEPDNGYTYSNSNYFLLSCIVEKVSGQTYKEYIRKNIFEPLGMKNSGFISETKVNPDWAKGIIYKIRADELDVVKGAGDIVSTGPDMVLWMKGLSGGKVISDKSFKEMSTDYSSQTNYHYGYAFFVNYNGGISHPGNIEEGYVAYDYINKEKDAQIFLSTNIIGLSTVEAIMLELSAEISK